MRLKIGAVFASLMIASVMIGSGAFTTATLTREANIPVVDDDTGIVGISVRNAPSDTLAVNQSGTTNGGSLELNFANTSNSQGANVNAKFEYGDNSSAANAANSGELNSNTTITIANNDSVKHTFQLTYESTGATGDDVTFVVYNSSTTNWVTNVTASTGTQSTTVGSGEQLDLVVIVDTKGETTSSDLSGTLNVTAT